MRVFPPSSSRPSPGFAAHGGEPFPAAPAADSKGAPRPTLGSSAAVTPGLLILGLLILTMPSHLNALQASPPQCPESSRAEACEVRSVELPLADGRLQVDGGPSGSITVEGWDGSDVRAYARISARSRMGRSAEGVVERVEIDAAPGRLGASGPRGLLGGPSWTVSYWIQVPRGAELSLETTNGRVDVEGVGGPIRARSTNGRVRLHEVDGWFDARTTNGSLEVAIVQGAALRAPLELRGTNGSVTLVVPPGLDARIQASTTNGSIGGDVDMDTSGSRGNRQATATLGAGGPEITLRTTNGSIRVRIPEP